MDRSKSKRMTGLAAAQEGLTLEGREILLTVAPYPHVEAIMRLRALAEISASLPTDELLNIALEVAQRRRISPRSGEMH